MEALRSYAILSSINGAHETDIELRDTANALMTCNYISVDASGDNAGLNRLNKFKVSINPKGITTPLANQTTASGDLGSTSGSVSYYGDLQTPVELILSDADRVNTFRISQHYTGNVAYLITYGQVQRVNPRRNNLRDGGS